MGTGFSYVDNDSAYVTTKEQINEHLLILIQAVVQRFPGFKRTPLHLFGQSYGGKVFPSPSKLLLRSFRPFLPSF